MKPSMKLTGNSLSGTLNRFLSALVQKIAGKPGHLAIRKKRGR